MWSSPVQSRKKKIVLDWIDSGTLLEKWGIDAGELYNLIFNYNLQGWDIRGGAWIQPYYRSMTGYGSSTRLDSDLLALATFPIEYQKRELNRIVRFDPKDIEAFEIKHKELVVNSRTVTVEIKSTDTPCMSNINHFYAPDGRTLTYFGKSYSFTTKEAQAIRILYDAYQNGNYDFSIDYICEDLEIRSNKLKDIFQTCKEYREIVIPGKRKGLCRLVFCEGN